MTLPEEQKEFMKVCLEAAFDIWCSAFKGEYNIHTGTNTPRPYFEGSKTAVADIAVALFHANRK